MRTLVSTLATLAFASPAAALDFSSLSEVYRETHTESAFPLTPEIDLLGAGGMFGASNGNGGAAAPFQSGSGYAATASGQLGPILVETSALVTASAGVAGANTLGMRANFDNATLVANGVARATASVGTLFAGTNVSGAISLEDTGSVILTIAESTISSGIVGLDVVSLDAFDSALITAGSAFAIDILIDRSLNTAAASVRITGGGAYSSNTLALSAVAGPATAFVQSGIVWNSEPTIPDFFGGDDSFSVILEDIAVFSSIPEPTTGLLVACGLGWLGHRRRA